VPAEGCEDERSLVYEEPLCILGERNEVKWKENGEVGGGGSARDPDARAQRRIAGAGTSAAVFDLASATSSLARHS
jgi:hypothetical protein